MQHLTWLHLEPGVLGDCLVLVLIIALSTLPRCLQLEPPLRTRRPAHLTSFIFVRYIPTTSRTCRGKLEPSGRLRCLKHI
ncbi:hypothetical protein F5X96DRAFT_643757 [Biscogniauxia mediterranea]|nr:hypothetical protein F5X96DRAFT_643757 [Biscogniauxia mediterranea]